MSSTSSNINGHHDITGTPLLGTKKQHVAPENKWLNKVIDVDEAKDQILFALPMIITNVAYYFIPLVSVMFAGHLGQLQLAGSNLANSWAAVSGFALMVGLSGALETFCGQGYGAGLYGMLGIYLQASCIITLIFTFGVSVLWWYSDLILTLLGQDEQIAQEAGLYLKYLIPGLFAYGFLQNILRFLQTQCVVVPLVVCSLVPLALHVGIAYALVHWTTLAYRGAPLAASISLWISVFMLGLYVLKAKKFEQTWRGFSSESLSHVFSNLKLAIPSAAMVCLEYWAFEILVLLAGLMPNSEISTSLVAMCLKKIILAVYCVLSSINAAVLYCNNARLIYTGPMFTYADIPVTRCYLRLLGDLGTESQCQPSSSCPPSRVTREACLARMKSKLRARNKKLSIKPRLPRPLLATLSENQSSSSPSPAACLGVAPVVVTIPTTPAPIVSRVSARARAIWGPSGDPASGPSSVVARRLDQPAPPIHPGKRPGGQAKISRSKKQTPLVPTISSGPPQRPLKRKSSPGEHPDHLQGSTRKFSRAKHGSALGDLPLHSRPGTAPLSSSAPVQTGVLTRLSARTKALGPVPLPASMKRGSVAAVGSANKRKPASRKRQAAPAPNNVKRRKRAQVRGPRLDDIRMYKRLASVPRETWVLPDVNDCFFCGAMRFAGEPSGFCCASGQVSVSLPTMPAELWDLYVHDRTPIGVEFRRRSRTYNNTMSFTSIRVNYDTTLANGRAGVYTFRVQGMIRHPLRDLVPSDGVAAALQLFFYDTQQEMANRVAQSRNLMEVIIERLLAIVEPNPYARFFRSMVDVPNLADYAIVLRANTGLDGNVYNLPTVDQVAAIWNEGVGPSLARPNDIRVNLHGGDTTWIHYYYGCYDPLQYILLLPSGTAGWHAGIPLRSSGEDMIKDADDNDLASFIDPGIHDDPHSLLEAELENLQQNGRKKACVAMRRFYCYWFQLRSTDKTNILKTGRLVQQFQIDIYVKIETQRLDYLRHNQGGYEMRSESYGKLVESLARNETNGQAMGQRVHLSPSFTGGPRDIRRRFMNALTVVSERGRPSLFITATCNPAWFEIQSRLLPTELAQNRADLLVRVFRAKVMEMKKDIVDRALFGEVAGFFYVIEFQKRGLPHVHWLVILSPRHKITSTEAYDRFVSAEIPDQTENPHLHRCVVSHMMHGPCGDLNTKNVCMVKGKCRNYYPRPFQPRTEHRKDSYPDYMRRENGVTAVVRGKELDNRWVVPYNPYLLAKYDCHINVQVCSDIKGVKYLYKYCCKGNDQTTFNIVEGVEQEVIDEISDFQKSRWLCAPESMWRIYAFDLFEMYPPVYQLHVHLPGYQQVYYNSGQTIPTILDRERVGKTQLTEFFALNRESPEARAMNLLYSEVAQYFVWMQKKRYWKVRSSQVVIGRLVAVSIAEVERFHLRLLLNHVRAPTCFEDVMRFKGRLHGSFREAALARGLLEHDDHVRFAMQDAVKFKFPMVLRRYFAMILVYNSPADPRKLWEEFREHLSDDLTKACNDNIVEGYAAALKCIDVCLRAMNQQIGTYNLVDFQAGLTHDEVATREYECELNAHVDEADLLAVPKLNPGQRDAYDQIMDNLSRSDSCAYFIDGPGGSGKTFLYRVLLATVRSAGGIALAVASSGVAASLLPNGRTAHSRFKIPLNLDESMSCSINKSSGEAKLIIAAKLIIWDEASMTDKRAIEAVDLLLQDLMGNKLPFGGKTIVFGGDFRQTLPIVKRGSREDMVAACFVNSALWPSIQKIQLTHNMRADDDPIYAEYVLRVGNGTEPCVKDDVILLHKDLCLPYYESSNPLTSLISHVFPNLQSSGSNWTTEINNAILTPKNDCVTEINNLVIDMFPGTAMEYISTDYPNDPSQQAYHQDFMNAVDVGSLPPHVLLLKVNCPVMLLRNISPTEGLCNGTRLIITHLTEYSVRAVIAVGARKGQPVLIPRIPLQMDDMSKCPVAFKRHQYPIRNCFAMTINKSQGQTLERVGVYLPQPAFAHGQVYVAMSRVGCSSAIKFLIRPALPDLESTCETRNVVFREILQRAAV